MSKNVFANGNEISAKKDGNKVIAAMPDVCLSPPSPPAGPVPLPYPNSSDSSKTSGGSKSVKIGGQEVGLKNKSEWKSSNGDEAATKSLGMGVVSHNIQGPLKHAAWSMDVKFENYNVIRHMDLTTHNHSNPTNGDVGLDNGTTFSATVEELDCKGLEDKNEETRKGPGPPSKTAKESSTTLTTAQVTVSGKQYNTKAFSRAAGLEGKEGWAQGVGPERGEGSKKGANVGDSALKECSGGFDYKKKASNSRPHSSHTEARIIEDLFVATGGNLAGASLKMKIRVNNKKKPNSPSCKPCEHCKELICAAEKCGLKVTFCDKNNNEVRPCPDGNPQ